MATSEFSRTLLPALVIMVNESFWPPLARMPSAPLVQPAASSMEFAFATSCGYCGLASLLYAHETGGIEEVATTACLKYRESAMPWRSIAYRRAWRTALSLNICATFAVAFWLYA